jgi:hypothetical protein
VKYGGEKALFYEAFWGQKNENVYYKAEQSINDEKRLNGPIDL